MVSQQKAVSIEKREPRLYYELDQYLAWMKVHFPARLAWLTESPETVASREITAGRLARVQALLGRDDDAVETLSRTRFHVWEGESGIHAVYVAARLERGRRLLARGDAAGALQEFRATADVPANIDVGQGVGAHLAAVHHHVGLALSRLGRKEEATAAFRESAGVPAVVPEGHFWIGRSLEMLGREAEARRHFERLAATKPRPALPGRPLEVRMEAREGRSADLYVKALGPAGPRACRRGSRHPGHGPGHGPRQRRRGGPPPLSRRRDGPRRDGLDREAATTCRSAGETPGGGSPMTTPSMPAPSSPVRIAGSTPTAASFSP